MNSSAPSVNPTVMATVPVTMVFLVLLFHILRKRKRKKKSRRRRPREESILFLFVNLICSTNKRMIDKAFHLWYNNTNKRKGVDHHVSYGSQA